MTDQFYFKGEWFDSYKEFELAAIEWSKEKLNEESLDQIVNDFKKDILINFHACEMFPTNASFSKLLNDKMVEIVCHYINEMKDDG